MKNKKKSLRVEADKLWYKACMKKYGGKCELTDHDYMIQAHHFFPKSSYPMLRYDLDNGVLLTKGLHFNLHHKADPTVQQRIIEKRGIEWYNKLLKRSHFRLKHSFRTIKYYEKTIKTLESQS